MSTQLVRTRTVGRPQPIIKPSVATVDRRVEASLPTQRAREHPGEIARNTAECAALRCRPDDTSGLAETSCWIETMSVQVPSTVAPTSEHRAENARTFDFSEHKRVAAEHYQRVRPLYELFARSVHDILKEALYTADIKVASIEARAKSLESMAEKAAIPDEEDPSRPKYADPLAQIADLAAARVITFFLRTIQDVDQIITAEFQVKERTDKSEVLLQEERLGYQSIHYLVELKPNRTALPEYARYRGLTAEIQLRTVLQHAWAEIEHDIQYKSIETIPAPIRRRFMALAGVLEIADREFQAVQLEDERLRLQARASVQEGRLEQVEITGDALKAYLDQKLGSDWRIAIWTYEYMARLLRRLGFTNFRQIDECIAPYDDDALSRSLHGNRQGQRTRFEDMVLAAMADRFIERHVLAHDAWYRNMLEERLGKIRKAAVPVGQYDPSAA
jgi:ppGpp synthetase/RelA/SpoT-type nucleotidyltranferase